ncbi:YihA family ribosome biogenesis GTP-binding protein [bacterium]|nr:YihA family ribosome biogenesis GTP-binding protein [bacterium]
MPLQFNKAKFTKSYSNTEEITNKAVPQFAFIGRSNVGKSSLINAITERKDLAKTSSVPGKTQLLNFFRVDDQLFLVDLPGYGYAKVSKKKREVFEGLISDYILKSEHLFVLFILIDAAIPPQQIDMDFVNWCGFHRVPIALIFTKTDKKKAKQTEKNINDFQMELSQAWDDMPLMFQTSSKTKAGIEEIQTWIEAQI